MTPDQITARKQAIAAELDALKAELARREAHDTLRALFLRPGVPLSPAELAELHLLQRKDSYDA